MPNKPGERRGGRPKGVPNRAQLEKALIAERELQEARKAGKKLAKDVLEEFMLAFGAMAARAQPRPGNEQNANVREFEKWSKLAVATAARLAPFQSPTMRAILVSDAAAAATGMLGNTPSPVVMSRDAELLRFPTDALGVSRIYRRMVDGATDDEPPMAPASPTGGLTVVQSIAVADDIADEVGPAEDGEIGPADDEPL